jgi:hypothetical protein
VILALVLAQVQLVALLWVQQDLAFLGRLLALLQEPL